MSGKVQLWFPSNLWPLPGEWLDGNSASDREFDMIAHTTGFPLILLVSWSWQWGQEWERDHYYFRPCRS